MLRPPTLHVPPLQAPAQPLARRQQLLSCIARHGILDAPNGLSDPRQVTAKSIPNGENTEVDVAESVAHLYVLKNPARRVMFIQFSQGRCYAVSTAKPTRRPRSVLRIEQLLRLMQ